MSVRTPVLSTVLLAAIILGCALSGDTHSLLLLTPALAILIPLLSGFYVGERSLEKLASLLSRFGMGRGRSVDFCLLSLCDWLFAGPDTSAANGSRGPPLRAFQP